MNPHNTIHPRLKNRPTLGVLVDDYKVFNGGYKVQGTNPELKTPAQTILETANSTLTQRAKLRDSTSTGERSMAKAVAIFNAWQGDTGDHLTEEEGWRFMIALKQARMAGGRFHLDDYVDLASYSALLGEHLGDLNASSQET